MHILIIAGNSSLALALKPVLSQFATVITAGKTGCDIALDIYSSTTTTCFPSNIDIVINTASGFHANTPDAFINTVGINTSGLLKIARACTDANIRHLIHVSSIFTMLDVNSPFYSLYSLTKKQGDDLLQLYSRKFDLPCTIIRPSQFYGSEAAIKRHHPFLGNIIDKALRHENIILHGSNDAMRNFIHVEDVAQCIALICQKKIFGMYNCVYPDHVHYSEIAKAVIAAFDSHSNIIFNRAAPDIIDNIPEIDTALYTLLDYHPRISIQDGMKKIAQNRQV